MDVDDLTYHQRRTANIYKLADFTFQVRLGPSYTRRLDFRGRSGQEPRILEFVYKRRYGRRRGD